MTARRRDRYDVCEEESRPFWGVLDVTGLVVLGAVRGVRKHRFSYWAHRFGEADCDPRVLA